MARILLVDDEPDQLEIRRLVLENAGHQVCTARSAAAAALLFRESDPQVVVMDLRLPRTEDGLALIRDLRACSASLCILVLSGWTSDLSNLPEAGLADGVLNKPVRSQRLLHIISQLAV